MPGHVVVVTTYLYHHSSLVGQPPQPLRKICCRFPGLLVLRNLEGEADSTGLAQKWRVSLHFPEPNHRLFPVGRRTTKLVLDHPSRLAAPAAKATMLPR